MAIVYLDKIKSGIPTTIIEGKDVDSVILVDPDPNMPPFFKVNKLTLNTSTNIITVHDGGGNPTSTFSIDASVVNEALDAVKVDVIKNAEDAEKAHNLAVSAQTEAALNTANLAALDVTVAHNSTKLAEHTIHLDALSVDMTTVKHSARSANLTADEALAKANSNTAKIESVNTEIDAVAADVASNRVSIEGISASLDITDEAVSTLGVQVGELGTMVEANELSIAELDTEYVGLLSDIERIDAEIAAIEAETVLRNNTNISVKDISTSTGNFNLDDPVRAIDRYDFKINNLSEMTMTGDYVDLYTKPITNLGSGGNVDTNAATIGDVKAISANTNPDLSGYVQIDSDASLKSVTFGNSTLLDSSPDEGLILKGDTLTAKSNLGYNHFVSTQTALNVQNKKIEAVNEGTNTGDAVNKGQLDVVSGIAYGAQDAAEAAQSTADAADTLSKTNQTNISNLSSSVGANSSQISSLSSDLASVEAEVLNKVTTDSDASLRSLTIKGDGTTSNLKGDHILRFSVGDVEKMTLGSYLKPSVPINMDGRQIHGVLNGTADSDAVNKSQLSDVETVASAADTLSKTNASSISSINTEVSNISSELTTTTALANKTSSDVTSLTATVGGNSAQISTNTKNIGDNTTAIATKASQSDLNSVQATANAADTLSKSNQSAITGLNTEVDNNTAAIATKASQTELNTVKATANAADSLSKSNAAKLDNKISTSSDAVVNSLINTTGNYDSTDNFDLRVNNSNVLSATASALYAKKNLVMQNNSLIKSLGDAVDLTDAMNLQSVKAITDILSGRIDSIAEGAGDESDYVMVNGFSGLKFDNKTLDVHLAENSGDTQAHIVYNAIRKARPVKGGAVKWIMHEFVTDSHDIWKFLPVDVTTKTGFVKVVHDGDSSAKIEVHANGENYAKLLNFNIGTGSSGKRNDWQRFKSRINGFNGFNTGQILTHDELDWEPTNNARTNMIRIRNAMPNGCVYICWHNPNSNDYKYRMVYHGTSSTIESTTGVCVIWKHGGDSSVGGLYINTASTDGIGWARLYIGGSNGWAAFAKQDNRSATTSFSNTNSVTIPFHENREDLNVWVVDVLQDLTSTYMTDTEGNTYQSVGKYGVGWDGNWTREWAYHNAYHDSVNDVYIAFDYSVMQWRKFTPQTSHIQIGQASVATSLSFVGERSLFPTDESLTLELGDITLLPHLKAETDEIYNPDTNTSTINFGESNMWGYIDGGGVPLPELPPYEDGYHPTDPIEP